jgi:hypothetical protein
MTNPRLRSPVEKSIGYRHVQHRVVELRRAAGCPILDHRLDPPRLFHPDLPERARIHPSVKGQYRADLWAGCAVLLRGLDRVAVDCRHHRRRLRGAGRQPVSGRRVHQLVSAYQAAEYINAEHDGRVVQIFYIGDY